VPRAERSCCWLFSSPDRTGPQRRHRVVLPKGYGNLHQPGL